MKLAHAVPMGLVMAIVAAASGCAERPQEDASASRRFVFITNGESPYWDAAEKGWEDAAAEAGVKVQFLRNSEGSAAGQIRLLDQVASSNIAGVAISVVDVSAVGIVERLKKIGEKVPVITVDSDTASADRDARRAYVGTNNREAGKVAGRIARKLLADGGKWIGFVGNADADNAKARIEGFIEAAGEKFTKVDVLQDSHDKSKARENVRASTSKDVQLMFGIYSYNAPAIAEVISEAGKRDQIKVLTFDAEANTIRALDEGKIDATIVQNTYDMGAQSLRLLKAMAENDKTTQQELIGSGTELDTGVRVIVPNNSSLEDPSLQKVGDFKSFMESKGLQST